MYVWLKKYKIVTSIEPFKAEEWNMYINRNKIQMNFKTSKLVSSKLMVNWENFGMTLFGQNNIGTVLWDGNNKFTALFSSVLAISNNIDMGSQAELCWFHPNWATFGMSTAVW